MCPCPSTAPSSCGPSTGQEEMGDRELLEDEAEGVAASQSREVRVHRGYDGGRVRVLSEGLGGGGVGAGIERI
ncbi:hypothetical protein ACFX2F_030338 [Malus domestica]